ncbi:MAG TPA: hypothetical protein VKS21_13880, partial [Spirochaetota bacterium]|nr:hypothetical protein [Spirochaetota bacterium]
MKKCHFRIKKLLILWLVILNFLSSDDGLLLIHDFTTSGIDDTGNPPTQNELGFSDSDWHGFAVNQTAGGELQLQTIDTNNNYWIIQTGSQDYSSNKGMFIRARTSSGPVKLNISFFTGAGTFDCDVHITNTSLEEIWIPYYQLGFDFDPSQIDSLSIVIKNTTTDSVYFDELAFGHTDTPVETDPAWTYSRSIWHWYAYHMMIKSNSAAAYSDEDWVNMVGFLQAPHGDTNHPVTRLYAHALKYDEPGKGTFTWFDDGGIPNRRNLARTFIRDCHSKGIEVYCILLDDKWFAEAAEGPDTAVMYINKIFDYNISVAADEKIDGFVTDIEHANWTNVTNLMRIIQDESEAYITASGHDQFVYGHAAVHGYPAKPDLPTYPENFPAIMQYSKLITLMSYNSNAHKVKNMLYEEVMYASTNEDGIDCIVEGGIETANPIGGYCQPYETLSEYGYVGARDMLDEIDLTFSGYSNYSGSFYHAWQSMTPEVPYPNASNGGYYDIATTTDPDTYTEDRAPYTRFLYPNLGGLFSGTITLQWFHQDRERDNYTFSIFISSNGGADWLNVAAGLGTNDRSYELDTSLYPNATNYYIKIIADQGNGIAGWDKTDRVMEFFNPTNPEKLTVTLNNSFALDVISGSIKVNAMAFNIQSSESGDLLENIFVENTGTAFPEYIESLDLWVDCGLKAGEWDSDDYHITNLTWQGSGWGIDNLDTIYNTNLDSGGIDFVITIDVNLLAKVSTFQLQIPVNTLASVQNAYGPTNIVSNNGIHNIYRDYILIDDFNSYGQYFFKNLNDIVIGTWEGRLTDEDWTMSWDPAHSRNSNDYVTNDQYLVLKWNDTDDYWYTVLDDDGLSNASFGLYDGIEGMNITNINGTALNFLQVVWRAGDAGSEGVSFDIGMYQWGPSPPNTKYRVEPGVFVNITNFQAGGLTSDWVTNKIPLSLFGDAGIDLSKVRSIR